MYVVKLGGSLYNTPQLRAWLNRLAEVSMQVPIVMVPGGGPFADQVRQAQQLHHFSDSHAHQMALLAMAQFGTLIAGLQPACSIISSVTSVDESNLSIWLPDSHLMQIDEIAHSWDMTSDSIALWLAQQIQAQQLILVKRKLLDSHTIEDWQQHQIIDPAFISMYQSQPIPTLIADWNQADLFPNEGVSLQ